MKMSTLIILQKFIIRRRAGRSEKRKIHTKDYVYCGFKYSILPNGSGSFL